MSSLGRFGVRPGTGQESSYRLGTRKLKTPAIIREILYPLTELAVALAMIVFLLLEVLAEAAGLLGIWLFLVILPAYFRYLLYLLEARANGREAPPPGGELFNWVENFWSLFPLVLLCLLIWGTYFLGTELSVAAAIAFGAIVLLIFPASMAVLATTRSPVESINPAALIVLLKNCGREYLGVPLVIVAMFFIIWNLAILGAPTILLKASAIYASVLMFTLTGSVLHEKGGSISVDLPPVREPGIEQLQADQIRERTQVLNHAYGFISRGNRHGGLQHLYGWLEKEADPDPACQWFFEQMLNWESTQAALVFAQAYLSLLLKQRRDIEALKLIARCRLVDARFKPLAQDSGTALAAAEREGNDELYEYLKR